MSIRVLPLILFALAANAQTLSYRLLPVEGASPSPRLDGTIAYDANSRQLWLFGGSANQVQNDLWHYSLDERRWIEVSVSGARPPARLGHVTIFDPIRRRLIVFGGQAAGVFSDTWAFDPATGTWQQLAGDNAGPSRRYGHSGIYDAARDRLVISHGFTSAGRFDDTWAFDLKANAWRNISPASGRPLRRCLHHAVYDGGNQMLLYGGCASGFGPCPLADLWSFDLNANRWTEVRSAAQPAGRQHYGIAFDELRKRLVLFGGSGRGTLGDTWEFDPAANEWREAVLAGTAPGPRSRHQGLFAADRGVSYFFGGSTDTGLSNELWALEAASTGPRLASSGIVNAFSGAGGAVAPGEIVSLFGSALGPMAGFTTVAAGGRLPVAGAGVAVTFNDVAAPLYFAREDQVNVQVPYEVAGNAEARVVVTVNGVAGPGAVVALRATHPGLFPRAFHAGGRVVTAENPAAAGEVLIFFATGQGVTNPASVTGALAVAVFPDPVAAVALRMGGREAEVLFRGQAPGTAGVMQINARVPAGLSGEAEVVLAVGGVESLVGVRVAIQ